ncbi:MULTISPECIES: hypothetical protein [Microcystis]|jgi:hypothetical protein|uniref:Uncharacterized protein n=7 Tax=Microcystis TaxID=1125 RepID=I4HQW8_MICAE|nr:MULTISPECIES: hypothetical protein [Microcystis]MCA2902552.1 hypothetical protein [Microcystis sp. M035S1]MCZ8126757.1 hypothetical protein [Microcystis sp. LE19-114.1B]MCZ8191245.1 hypothetical protein [Microcystis sp. LE19-338.1B]MCZ8307700.1 hypothetical protein [Microcystis sp. LE19-98.1E]MCZ8358658.1 hypothetical protein [Microcystis sp. LE19-388.1G]GBE75273.1 hypothetical protein myaer87_25000 [Microcystis aeruginosa NIES-87]
MTNPDNNLQNIQEPILNAPEDVRKIIDRVLKLERDKLYQRNPRNINDDVLTIIKEVIQ